MTYRNYAKQNGHTDVQIEEMVDGLFGADAEMTLVQEHSAYTQYDMGNGYYLNVNNSSNDTVELVDDNGTIEEWTLEY